MKLIRIGSSKGNDLVLHSSYVSGQHAEITLLDNGEILLEDKNSTNGTYIGEQRLPANEETPVRRGDKIRFGDQILDWRFIPKNDNFEKYKKVINIGSHQRNDIIITDDPYLSRYHATFLIGADGKAYIRDHGSRNGTQINGSKVSKDKDTPIRKGDNIVCGQSDITSQLAPHMPNPMGWLKWTAIGIGSVAVLIGIFFLVKFLMPEKTADPMSYRPAVAYVKAYYHYTVKVEDNPIPEYWNGEIDMVRDMSAELMQSGQGTAFFIDRDGHLATNRHIAVPWEYSKDSDYETVKRLTEKFLTTVVPEDVTNIDAWIAGLNSTPFGQALISAVNKSNRKQNKLNLLYSFVKKIQDSRITISGKMDHICLGYPGRNYTSLNEYDICTVLAESGSDEKDIAILELNKKKTPDEIKYIFDVDNFYQEKLEPLKDELYTIGYPKGDIWSFDQSIKSLEPAVRELKCSKVPGKYDFEFQGEAIGGASGSPIFNNKGQIVGILWGRWADGSTFGKACQARYLKELYDEKVK